MRKLLQSEDAIRITELFLKNDLRLQLLYNTTLSRNPELLREVAADVRKRMDLSHFPLTQMFFCFVPQRKTATADAAVFPVF